MSMQLSLPGIELPPAAKAAPAPYSYIRSAMHEAANRIAKHLSKDLDAYLAELPPHERALALSLGADFASYAVGVARQRLVEVIKATAEAAAPHGDHVTV